jgi:hypothetical protein
MNVNGSKMAKGKHVDKNKCISNTLVENSFGLNSEVW